MSDGEYPVSTGHHRHSGSESRIYIYLTSIICLSTPYKRQFYVIFLFKHSSFKFGLQLKLFQVSLSSPKHSHCFKNSNKTLYWQTHIRRKQQATGHANCERFERVTNPKDTLSTEPSLLPSSAPYVAFVGLSVKNLSLGGPGNHHAAKDDLPPRPKCYHSWWWHCTWLTFLFPLFQACSELAIIVLLSQPPKCCDSKYVPGL